MAKKRNYPKHRKSSPRSGDHLFKKGHTGGRPKGSKNKLTRDIKLAMLNAFEKLGGERWLFLLGKQQKKTFAQLLGRMLPMHMTDAPPEETAEKIRQQLAAMDAATRGAKEEQKT